LEGVGFEVGRNVGEEAASGDGGVSSGDGSVGAMDVVTWDGGGFDGWFELGFLDGNDVRFDSVDCVEEFWEFGSDAVCVPLKNAERRVLGRVARFPMGFEPLAG